MRAFPTVDESRDRLQRAGWSVGEIATAAGWLVTGRNGDVDLPYCLLRQEWIALRLRKLSPEKQAGSCTIAYAAGMLVAPARVSPDHDPIHPRKPTTRRTATARARRFRSCAA
jgi:hypothetical protein